MPERDALRLVATSQIALTKLPVFSDPIVQLALWHSRFEREPSLRWTRDLIQFVV